MPGMAVKIYRFLCFSVITAPFYSKAHFSIGPPNGGHPVGLICDRFNPLCSAYFHLLNQPDSSQSPPKNTKAERRALHAAIFYNKNGKIINFHHKTQWEIEHVWSRYWPIHRLNIQISVLVTSLFGWLDRWKKTHTNTQTHINRII